MGFLFLFLPDYGLLGREGIISSSSSYFELNFLVLVVVSLKLIFSVLRVSSWSIFQFGMFIYDFTLVSAEEGQDEYEKDGFIVDDVEEEEEEEEERADSDEERQKKKKKRKKK